VEGSGGEGGLERRFAGNDVGGGGGGGERGGGWGGEGGAERGGNGGGDSFFLSPGVEAGFAYSLRIAPRDDARGGGG
jgi:hypothetical protein